MTNKEITRLRLANQHINGKELKTPKELVHWLGAVQAQDYTMCKWGLGVRLPGSTDETVEAAINDGSVIRTHVLRPTWHLVAPEDLRWMLQLSAKNIQRAMNTMNTYLELDEKTYTKANNIITKALEGGKHLDRKVIADALEAKKIRTNNMRLPHLLARAETDALICSGPMQGKQATYALIDERIPAQKKLTKEEALAKLALRYFTSHAPATLQDFHWWSGLNAGDAKTALELVKDSLESEEIDGITYWAASFESAMQTGDNKLVLLPAFDEYLVSYKNRSAALNAEHNRTVITVNGIFKPIIVHQGKVIGFWKAVAKKTGIEIEKEFFDKPTGVQEKLCSAQEKVYQKFRVKKPARS